MSAAPEAMAEILESLRWKENMVVTNHSGDRVWLKPCVVDGKRVGITDCCFADDPCERHALRTGVGLFLD